MATYKTNNPAILAADAKFNADRKDLYVRAQLFAKEFNATPIIVRSGDDVFFVGVGFDELPHNLYWRKPANKTYEQCPRSSLAKGTPEQRKTLQDLNTKWKDLYQQHNLHERVSMNDTLVAMGTDFSNCAFGGGGIAYFVYDGWMYIETKVKLNDTVTEIMGSEFESAHAANNLIEQQSKATA